MPCLCVVTRDIAVLTSPDTSNVLLPRTAIKRRKAASYSASKCVCLAENKLTLHRNSLSYSIPRLCRYDWFSVASVHLWKVNWANTFQIAYWWSQSIFYARHQKLLWTGTKAPRIDPPRLSFKTLQAASISNLCLFYRLIGCSRSR